MLQSALMFSLMDGSAVIIRSNPYDADNTAFWTPTGNFYYTVTLFGLKNAGATFHDILHVCIEDYVDDSEVSGS